MLPLQRPAAPRPTARIGLTPFNAALIAHVEATRERDEEKNPRMQAALGRLLEHRDAALANLRHLSEAVEHSS